PTTYNLFKITIYDRAEYNLLIQLMLFSVPPCFRGEFCLHRSKGFGIGSKESILESCPAISEPKWQRENNPKSAIRNPKSEEGDGKMNFAYRVSVALSVMILFVIGLGVIAISLEFITPEMVTTFWQTPTSKDSLALAGLILWVVCLFVIHIDYKLGQQEKQGVTLHNPLGEVKISGTTLIETIKQVGTKEPYVKEIKWSRIKSSRKGLKVILKAVIWTEIPIPEAMTALQEKIKAYLEEIIGVPKCEEVRILIVKILHTEGVRLKDNKKRLTEGGDIYG
ncbi:MAG: hypothetical protein QME81_16850, partial [bacterium]|nr:hypothetical protein [bacterium]